MQEAAFCQVTSSGLAAGATFDQAALHATLELVERDALMLTWLSERPARRVILDQPLEEGLARIVESIQRRGACVELYLLNAGIDIPVAVCAAFGDGTSWPGATVGCGADLDPRIAIRKAILEQGQTGPGHARLLVEGRAGIPAGETAVRSFADHALYYLPSERSRAFDSLRRAHSEPLRYSALAAPPDSGLSACLCRIAAAGIRIAAADVTPPDVALLPMRVVRAVSPGLQPLHCGFGMERLPCARLRSAGWRNPQIHPFC
jgi:ribosomal protein S12 methylthiotransferase accessory factor